jgi:hypothetical protein
MTVLFSVTRAVCGKFSSSTWQLCCTAALACALLFLPPPPNAQATTLQALTTERQMLSHELEQYQKTLDILQTDGTPPEQSSNPAVKKLAQEMVSIRERLIAITEQEVTLLQEQIIDAKAVNIAPPSPRAEPAVAETAALEAIESKPLRTHSADYTLEQEAENVERLHSLLSGYYTELQESARILPTAEEISRREAAQRDARKLSKIPFSVDKVRLNGSEGSTALTQITQRLMDSSVPESRRDIAPICSIKTRLFGSLVGSETRSLKPVGKNHYVARIRLQPGDTTLSIQDQRWQVRVPQNLNARDFLVTLYRPPGAAPELHVFAIDDLLAEERPHIPAWLPDELKINSRAG